MRTIHRDGWKRIIEILVVILSSIGGAISAHAAVSGTSFFGS